MRLGVNCAPFFLSSTRRLLAALLFIFFPALLSAQGDMRFFGTATKDKKPLAGASVTVLMDNTTQIYQLTTGKNGKFKFTVDLGHEYRISFSAPGCVPMFMTLNLKVPPEKSWIYPDYVAEIPFFEANTPNLNTELFAKEPFIKVVFDGRTGFGDDPSWRFIDRVFKDVNEDKKRQELLALEEARKAEERAKRDAEIRARDEEERRKLLLKQEEEARKRAEEEARRLRAIAEARAKADQEKEKTTLESEAIRLEREKQERLAQEQKNRGVKTQYENSLLKLVAESERQANMQKYTRMQKEAEANSIVQTLRMEAERKAQSHYLREQEKLRERHTLENRQVKSNQEKRLVEAAAAIERNAKEPLLKPVAQTSALKYSPSPNLAVTLNDGTFCDTRSTVVSWPGGKRDVLRAESWWWGAIYYYLNDKEIDEKTYHAELAKHKAAPAPLKR